MRYMPEPVDNAISAGRATTRPNGCRWYAVRSRIWTSTFGVLEGARLEISGEDDLSMPQDKSPSRKAIEGRAAIVHGAVRSTTR